VCESRIAHASWREVGGSLVKVVGAKVMRVIDADQCQRVAFTLDMHRFVHEHPYPERFHARHHADGVVVAEHGIDGLAKVRPQACQRFERGPRRARTCGTKIASQHTDVMRQPLHALDQSFEMGLAHVDVQVAQMQQP